MAERRRFADGTELQVGQIEERFLGREGMIAFIEDTQQRWLEKPSRADADIEVILQTTP